MRPSLGSLSHPAPRHRFRLGAVCIGIVILGTACTTNIDVKTQVAPQASFGAYRSFVVLTPRSGNGNPAAQNDPMLDNSITNQAIRHEVRRRLIARGYQASDREDADLGVAFYAASREVLDVTTVNYGYPYRPWWWRQEQQVVPVTQGTVVIDVIDRHTNRLIWRGSGRSDISDNPDDYAKQLRRTVDEVLKKLPHAAE